MALLSMYTVACACAQVVSDLLVARTGKGFFRSGDYLVASKRKEALRALKKPENFLKHADLDPEDTLWFSVELIPHTLVAVGQEYWMLTGRFEKEMAVFSMWYVLKYPEAIVEGEYKSIVTKAAALLRLKPDEYGRFLQMLDKPMPGYPS